MLPTSSARWKPDGEGVRAAGVCAASRSCVREVAIAREDREPERAADLLGGVEQRGGEAGLVGGHAGVGGGGDGDEHGAEAERHDHHARQQVGDVGAVDGDPREPVHAAGGDQRAADDQRPRADAGQELRGDAGGDDRRRR